jgi:hypothetical protein
MQAHCALVLFHYGLSSSAKFFVVSFRLKLRTIRPRKSMEGTFVLTLCLLWATRPSDVPQDWLAAPEDDHDLQLVKAIIERDRQEEKEELKGSMAALVAVSRAVAAASK